MQLLRQQESRTFSGITQISAATWEVILVCEQTEIFHLFFIFAWLLPLAAVAQYSRTGPTYRARSFDVIWWVGSGELRPERLESPVEVGKAALLVQTFSSGLLKAIKLSGPSSSGLFPYSLAPNLLFTWNQFISLILSSFFSMTFIWILLFTFLSYSLCNSVDSVQTVTTPAAARAKCCASLTVCSMLTETLAEWRTPKTCCNASMAHLWALNCFQAPLKRPVVGTEPSKASISVLFLFLRLTSTTLSGPSNIINVLD